MGDERSDRSLPSEGPDRDLVRARNIGIGCLTTLIGFWSGGMIAVLLGRLVEAVRGSAACEGLPICNWYIYAGIGAALGAVSLPLLVLRRLRRRSSALGSMTRG
jgi:hypothetical protein